MPAPGETAWFLDIDGTLLELAPSPDSVEVDGWLRALIVRLRDAAGGAVALISGRAIATVDRLFAPLHLPVAGQHGVERRDAAGVLHHHEPPFQELAGARHALADWVSRHPGALIEDKRFSLAVHYRQAPALAERLRRFLEAILAGSDGALRLQPGKMVFELKPAGRDKGVAIGEFLGEPPFLGRVPVFVGDDLTDEYGFEQVNLRGGLSVKVGDGPTCAGWRLPDVAAVRGWLEIVLDAGGIKN